LSSAETTTADEAPATDEVRAGLLAAFEDGLGDGAVASHVEPGVGLWVRVSPEAWAAAGELAKARLGCTFFDFLSAIDWMPSPFGRYEDAEVDTDTSLAEKVATAMAAERTTGYAGGDTRFQVFAHVVNVVEHHDVFLKVDVPESMTLPTWSHLYHGANWHERETREMFGIEFAGHPDPRNLYLPGEFEGFPLRKDFPLLSRVVRPWPGIVDVEPMPGEGQADEAQSGGAGGAADEESAEVSS